jgi:hypothetical protein
MRINIVDTNDTTVHKHVTDDSQTTATLFNWAHVVGTQACLTKLFTSGQYIKSLVQDKITQYFDRTQPSPKTSKDERNLPCRQEVLVNSPFQIVWLYATQYHRNK